MTEVGPSMAAFGGSESCPNCSAQMAPDQRYCLNCGHRRGEPRLPFMDAVVFMESTSASGGGAGAALPPPPSQAKGPSRMNANAALIAGVATLVLAIGVGFLIGRSGHENAPQAAAAPQIIKVGGGGESGSESAGAGTEEEATEKGGGKEAGGKSEAKKSGSKTAKHVKPSEVKEGSKQEEEIAAEKTAETLHAEGPLAKPTAKVGETCEKGTPGCEGEEFTGNFFGE